MKMVDTIVRSLRGLHRARQRTYLTGLAIGVGAFSISFAVALDIGGGQYAMSILTTNTEAHSLWVSKKQDQKGTNNRPSEYTGSAMIRFNDVSVKPIDQTDLDKIMGVDGVERTLPVFLVNSAYVNYDKQTKYQAVVGTYRSGVTINFAAGTANNLQDDEIVIPDGYREALGFKTAEESIGKTIDVTAVNRNDPARETEKTFPFKIKGVIRKTSLSLALIPTQMFVTQESSGKLNDYVAKGSIWEDKFIAGNVQLDPKADIDEVKKHIQDLGYLAQSPNDVYGALYQFVGVLQSILVGFGFMAVVTAVIGIVNTQYISVLERTQEIGLMKALGMSGRDVGRLFKIESGLIGLIGSVIGVVLAYLVSLLINPMISQALKLDQGTFLAIFTWEASWGIILFMTVTATLAGLLPSRQAAHLDPIEALRSDGL